MSQPLPSTRSATVGAVREAIAGVLPGVDVDDLPWQRSLKDLGADSVDRIEILLSIVGKLGLKAELSEFSDIESLDALVAYLCQRGRR